MAAQGKSARSVAIVGGGLGGVAAGAMLQRAGYEDFTLFEKGERLGGVWNFNTYPGLTCDIPSHLYELSFAPNPNWSRRFSPGPEIRTYVEDVARRYGVSERSRLGTEVQRASFDEARSRWTLQTRAGEHEADVLIAACGQLSVPKTPQIPGLDSFAGPSFHTARWRHDVDLAGKRVAVVGTGCTAIQVVPSIQPEVARLDVYQRSPGWTLPKMDFAYAPRTKRLFKRFPILQRLDRRATFAFMEFATTGMTRRPWMLAPLRAAARRQIKRQVSEPELRRKVTPTDAVGCKRVMLTDDWYPALGKPNVELITDRIAEVVPDGLVTETGEKRPADVLILATGFATHGFVAPMEIAGREGRTLTDAWGGLPRAYLGITVPGFPNLFLLYGPNTNGGAGSVIDVHEGAMAHVIDAMHALDDAGARAIEVQPAAAEQFDGELRAALANTVWETGCSNWYVDANGNNPNQWPWTWSTYYRRTARIDPTAYALR
jgi:cation diffusion facilitator CzcD-associated flavoprotein CzcO